MCFQVFSVSYAGASTTATAQLIVYNRSGYPMVFAIWKDGNDCTGKIKLNPDFNINSVKPQNLIVTAEKTIAIGVAILEIQDKLPLACDYILSLKLSPATEYALEYNVHNRRCYGQLFKSENGVKRMVTTEDTEALTERIPAFGWDNFEPGCEEK